MFRIALTGGIGAGKSVALERLVHLGAVAVDYDVLSRRAVEPGTVGLEEVVQRFGPDVLQPDGALDRPAVARIVFADADARADLSAIVHPIAHRLAAEVEAAAAAADPRAVVVHDIPLLAESGQVERFHLVVTVAAPAEVRRRRLIASRGMTEAEVDARLAAQADDERRAALADVVLDGSGEPEHLRAQVDALWQRVRAEVDAEASAEEADRR